MAAEMTANIRVGLAAGKCVAPRRKRSSALVRKPAVMWSAAAAGAMVLVGSAWWLNLSATDSDSIARIAKNLVHPVAQVGGAKEAEDRGAVVTASAEGVELRENGVAVSIPQAPTRPVGVTVSAPGSASARY